MIKEGEVWTLVKTLLLLVIGPYSEVGLNLDAV